MIGSAVVYFFFQVRGTGTKKQNYRVDRESNMAELPNTFQAPGTFLLCLIHVYRLRVRKLHPNSSVHKKLRVILRSPVLRHAFLTFIWNPTHQVLHYYNSVAVGLRITAQFSVVNRKTVCGRFLPTENNLFWVMFFGCHRRNETGNSLVVFFFDHFLFPHPLYR